MTVSYIPALILVSRYPPRISHALSDAADLDEDSRFLQEQARRYLTARPWEQLSGQAVFLGVKAGDWYQICAQSMDHPDGHHMLMVYPGWRDVGELQQAGRGQPPPLTMIAQFDEPDAGFTQAYEDGGWGPLDRFSARLMALAIAAIIDVAAAGAPTDREVSGQIQLPGRVRGRYRAVLKPPPENSPSPVYGGGQGGGLVPIVSKIRMDLLEEGDTTLTFMNIRWDTYRDLAQRAQLRVPSPKSFDGPVESVPVVLISDPIKRAWSIADKLQAIEPLNLSLMPMATEHGVVAVGQSEGYCLTVLHDEASGVRAWWQASTEKSGGAIALMVADTTPDPNSFDRWTPANVLAVFEFRSSTR